MRSFTACLLAFVAALAASPVGYAADSIVLSNQNGLQMTVLDIGAAVQNLLVPDRSGQLGDIVLGYDDPAAYANSTTYFGAIAGRVANRIANATFQLNDQRYFVTANDKANSLHGGKDGFSMKTWNLTEIDSDRGQAVRLTLDSPNGDQGYPGNVVTTVTYTLTPNNEVITDFEATTDAPTPISLTQHSYFNLDVPGDDKTVLNHDLFINGSYITPADGNLIPLGTFAPVAGTPYDFTTSKPIGAQITQLPVIPEDNSHNGYDNNYVLWGLTGEQSAAAIHNCNIQDTPQLAVTLSSPASGRAMDILTQTPGMLLYSGTGLDGSVIGKGGVAYPEYGGVALEAQQFPNYVNDPQFPQCILQPGQTYAYTTIWRFYTLGAAAPA